MKRKLPPAPPPTRATYKKIVTGVTSNELQVIDLEEEKEPPKPKIPIETLSQVSKEHAEIGLRRRHEETRRKHEEIARLCREGMSDKEIATEMGYTPQSVKKILENLRREGVDIPGRKRGRKCKE